MYLNKKALWDNFKDLDVTLKEELNCMSDNEIKEAFTNDLAFGTGGLRGILGAGTNRMNYYVVRKATLGFGNYLINNFDNSKERGVVIAHDNRRYSKEFTQDSAKVLTKLGFKVYLFNDLRPTPELSFAVRKLNCIAGIMITASHNPKEYNGYKIYDEDGCQLVPKYADLVIEEINKIENYFDIEISNDNTNIVYLDDSIDLDYQKEVSKIIINNVNKEFNIVYTPLHGTGQVFAHKVLQYNGFNCFPYEPQMTNDPNFSNVDSSNPEEEKAYKQAINYAKEIGACVVLATDPDADRLGVAILHNDEYILLNGNQTATLMIDYILKNKKEKNTLPENGYVFTTNVSSSLPIKIAQKYNLKTAITLTGFKFIGEQAKLIENKGEYVFGYEESYGSLISDFVRDKDGIQAILMACELVGYYKEKNKTLIDALEDIYKEYGYTKEGITNIVLTGIEGANKINEIMDYFRKKEIDFDIQSKEDNLLCIKTTFDTRCFYCCTKTHKSPGAK